MKPTWLHVHDFVEEFINKVKKFNVRRNGVYDISVDLEMKKFANKNSLLGANLNNIMMSMVKMPKLLMKLF